MLIGMVGQTSAVESDEIAIQPAGATEKKAGPRVPKGDTPMFVLPVQRRVTDAEGKERLLHECLTAPMNEVAFITQHLWNAGDPEGPPVPPHLMIGMGTQKNAALERKINKHYLLPALEVARKAGQAIHILDRFHIVAKLNKALDEIRAAEAKQLAQDGYEAMLKHSRWCFLKREENLTDKQQVKLDDLLQYDLKSVRGYLLKQSFQLLWEYVSPYWAGRFLDSWVARAIRSRIEPLRKFAWNLKQPDRWCTGSSGLGHGEPGSPSAIGSPSSLRQASQAASERSGVLGVAVTALEELAFGPGHCPARHGREVVSVAQG